MAKKRGSHTKKQLAESPDLLYGESQWKWEDIPNEPETFNASLDPSEWVTVMTAKLADDTADDFIPIVPEQLLVEVGEAVDGYMWTPTALFEGNTLTAKGHGVSSLKEFVDVADHLHQIGKRVFLYGAYKTNSAEWPLKVRYAII